MNIIYFCDAESLQSNTFEQNKHFLDSVARSLSLEFPSLEICALITEKYDYSGSLINVRGTKYEGFEESIRDKVLEIVNNYWQSLAKQALVKIN